MATDPQYNIDATGMESLDDIVESAKEEDSWFKAVAGEARDFLLAQQWCGAITSGFMDTGWEGILAIFYFRLITASPSADPEVWVVVGDLPPAYLDCYYCRNAYQALDAYTLCLGDWVDAVRAGGSVADLIPVVERHTLRPLPPTEELAGILESRVRFIRERMMPDLGT